MQQHRAFYLGSYADAAEFKAFYADGDDKIVCVKSCHDQEGYLSHLAISRSVNRFPRQQNAYQEKYSLPP